jgi:hypothetical protein
VAARPRPAPGLPPEARAVLLSAAGPEADAAFIDLVTSGLDGALLLQIALRERAATALWRRLERLGLAGLDPQLAAALRPHAMIAAFGQQHLEDRFADVVALLDDAGCELMLLKGAALAVFAYDSFGDRPMGDIDVVVPPHDARRAFDLLLRAGWEREMPQTQDAFYDRHHHLPPLKDARAPGAVIELHRDLLPAASPFELPVSDVRRDARTIPWRGRRLLVPSATHLLLHLCIHHAWSHTLSRGTWRTFSDLHVLTRSQVDWQEFVGTASAARAATCCYWTLRLGQRYAAAPVPDEVLRRLRPPGPDRWLGALERHFAATMLRGLVLCPSVELVRRMWEIGIRPGWSGHAKCRPWHEEPREVVAPLPLSSRMLMQLRRLAVWQRYAAAVLRA